MLLKKISLWCAGLTGWRRYGFAFLLGALTALALPPFYAMPLLWVLYPLFIWQFDGITRKRQAFALGWCFGWGQFCAGLCWLSWSMFTDIARWWWAVPFSAMGLESLFAIYPGLLLLLWWKLPGRGIWRMLAFGACYAIAEWLRSTLFTGFPWNVTAHGWIAWLPILQSYALFGEYMLGLLTLCAAALPALLAYEDNRRHRIAILGGIGIFIALAGWGYCRIPATPLAEIPDFTVRVVQPNISQSEKWSDAFVQQNFEHLLELSERLPPAGLKAVVWPESAVPYSLDAPGVTRAIGTAAPPGGLILTGAVRIEKIDGQRHYHNSLEAVNGAGQRVAHYDKARLVPFGEFMPFRHFLPVNGLAVGDTDFDPGTGPVTLALPPVPPFSPLICYEAIFPQAAIDPANRPAWLLNITNDGWFGASTGPRQHFAMVRARAVEQGLPLVRAANTGISGLVDPYGRIVSSLPLLTEGSLDITLPQGLPRPPFYTRIGEWPFEIALLVIFAGCLTQFRHSRINRS